MLKKTTTRLFSNDSAKPRTAKRPASEEGGFALLALILALAILGIVLTSSVAPNYQLSVQREKEAELFYRGQQMAEGIARWYNNGRLGPVDLRLPPVYGFLKEMKKLKEGVRINVNEVKFVRPSATRDPFDGEDWEPVYARDPRIAPFLQAWAGETGGIIPQPLMLIAGPPVKFKTIAPPINPTPSTGGATPPGRTPPGQPPQGGRNPSTPNNPDLDDDDDDDDDDDVPNDPLGHLFGSSNTSGLPIVGVAPRRKGRSVRSYFGLQNYEEWVFIYIPPDNRFNQSGGNQSGGNQSGRPQISQ